MSNRISRSEVAARSDHHGVRLRRSIAAVGVAIVALAGIAVPAAANAAQLDVPVFTSVDVAQESAYVGTNVRIDFRGTVPAGTSGGDTAVLGLSEYTAPTPGLSFPIVTSTDKATVAQAKVSADSRSLELTFTDYVNTHSNVTFAGYFGAAVVDPGATANGVSRTLQFTSGTRVFTEQLLILLTAPPANDYSWANGRWTRADHGTVTTAGAIEWRFEAGVSFASFGKSFVTVVPQLLEQDTTTNTGNPIGEPDNAFDCSTLSLYKYSAANRITGWTEFEAARQALTADDYRVISCTPEKIELEFLNLKNNEFVGGTVEAAVQDKDKTLAFTLGVEHHYASENSSAWSMRNVMLGRDIAGGEGGGGGQLVLTEAPFAVSAEGCGTEATVELPLTQGVTYTPVRTGNTVVVTATANEGYEIDPSSTTAWTFTIPAIVECPPEVTFVTPVAPSIKDSTTCGVANELVIAEQEGVIFTVGKADAEGFFTVSATPKDGYSFNAGDAIEWRINLGTVAPCDPEKPVVPPVDPEKPAVKPGPEKPAETPKTPIVKKPDNKQAPVVTDTRKGAVTGEFVAGESNKAPLIAGIATLALAGAAAATYLVRRRKA